MSQARQLWDSDGTPAAVILAELTGKLGCDLAELQRRNGGN
jgi:hypothetical protein